MTNTALTRRPVQAACTIDRASSGRTDIPAAAPLLPRNTILPGDCIPIMSTLPAASVDFVLTDPPYLCSYRDRSGRTVLNDNDNRWVGPAFAEVYRMLKRDAVCVSFYGWNSADLFLSAWRKAGFRPAGHIVFAKDYGGRSRYVSYRHECAYVLIKGNPPLPAEPLPDVLPWRYTAMRGTLTQGRQRGFPPYPLPGFETPAVR